MCGISGFIDFTNKTDLSVLKKMNDTMYHRGPDGEGLKMYNTPNATIGFGHRRLSIIDLSEGGSQPMEYKQFHIVFNGEIYNYNEIRNQLIEKGHTFHSHSDTEVILKGYEYKSSKLCIAIDAENVLEAGIQVRIPVQVIC